MALLCFCLLRKTCLSGSAGYNLFNVSVLWRTNKGDGLKQVSWRPTEDRWPKPVTVHCNLCFLFSWMIFWNQASQTSSTTSVGEKERRRPKVARRSSGWRCPVTPPIGTSETICPESAIIVTSRQWKLMVNIVLLNFLLLIKWISETGSIWWEIKVVVEVWSSGSLFDRFGRVQGQGGDVCLSCSVFQHLWELQVCLQRQHWCGGKPVLCDRWADLHRRKHSNSFSPSGVLQLLYWCAVFEL